MYEGCFPMGATTLINVAVTVINGQLNYGGRSFLYFIWAMCQWWLDIFISFACCWVGVHPMITHQNHSLDKMTAIWLLPVVTLIVASSSGHSRPFTSTNDPHHISHAAHPSRSSSRHILPLRLPFGPTGQSGYVILLIGQNINHLLPYHPSQSTFFEFFHHTAVEAISMRIFPLMVARNDVDFVRPACGVF